MDSFGRPMNSLDTVCRLIKLLSHRKYLELDNPLCIFVE